VVVAAQEAQMAFTAGGNVKTVNVALGDQVKAGQVLVELENVSAQVAVDQAKRNLIELTSAASIAAAEQAVASAQQALKDAHDHADSLVLCARVGYADPEYTGRDRPGETATCPGIGRLPEFIAQAGWRHPARRNGALVAMTNAQLLLNRLIAQYNWYAGRPSDIDAATAQANLDAAKPTCRRRNGMSALLKGRTNPGGCHRQQAGPVGESPDRMWPRPRKGSTQPGWLRLSPEPLRCRAVWPKATSFRRVRSYWSSAISPSSMWKPPI
jgi:hypothetical protein